MLAEAADEVLILIRKHDNQDLDPAQLASNIAIFKERCTRLFLQGGCFSCGYVAVMLEHLQHPHTYVLRGGEVINVGGNVNEAIKARCLGRMQCWLRLAMDVCDAEWPAFETIQAYVVFALSSDPTDGKFEAKIGSQLDRLARYHEVDAAQLSTQFERIHHVAQHIFKSSKVSPHEAWREALGRVQKALLPAHGKECQRQASERWGMTELRTVLAGWMSCMPTTSGLEQKFTSMERLYGQRRASLSLERERDILALACDVDARVVDEACRFFMINNSSNCRERQMNRFKQRRTERITNRTNK